MTTSGACAVAESKMNVILIKHEKPKIVNCKNYVSTRFGEKFIRVSFSIPTPEVEKFAEVFPKVMEELNI